LSISWEALQIAEHWRIAWGLEGEITIAIANMADVGYAKFDRRLHTAWPAIRNPQWRMHHSMAGWGWRKAAWRGSG